MLVTLVVLALLQAACQPQAETKQARKPKAKRHLVELATVEEDTLRMSTVYAGTLRYARTVRIFTQEEGRLTSLPWYAGDRVEGGQVLLELDDRLLRAELDKIVATARQAETNLQRFERLRKKGMVAEEEYLRAQTVLEVAKAERRVLETRLGYSRVTAPFDGIVAARLAETGDIVERHAHVLTLVDPTTLVSDIAVSELVMPHLQVGEVATVRIDALGDREFGGRILRIHPQLDARTRQGRVEIELKPVPGGATAGQFARVRLAVDALRRKVIPFAALRRDADGEYVFRVGSDNHAEQVSVRSGHRLGDRVEVVEGLDVGEQVVMRGFLGLKSGTTVTPVSAARQL
ncbi:MAG: efflux RND transporter periplasmic adaptor subunit [Gammaproteobacteria bacterium]|nr:efflux RND transporter periplasmic adaptor subunit [Gammaproteobacteria bacterium]